MVFLGGFAQQHEALRVGDDLGGQQRLADVFDEGFLVAVELEFRAGENLGRGHALFLHGAEAAGVDGFADQREGHARDRAN